VVVTHGAVLMRPVSASDSAGVVLRAGDRARLESDGRVVTQRAGATDDDLAWRAGRLVFRDASLGQVSADLRRWYGIELRVSDSSLVDRHVTASFTTADPAERVLDVIALTLGGQIERSADTVVLRAARAGGRTVR
jgi:transmembrane sensor